MLDWNQLHEDLEKAAHRHHQLAAKFDQFATFVAEQVTAQIFRIKGIGISLNLPQGFFTTNFAGRTLHFAFESVPEDDGTLVGKVTCHLKKEFPLAEYIPIGEFKFTGSGQSTLVHPTENAPISIDVDVAALHIVLDFIHESLTR